MKMTRKRLMALAAKRRAKVMKLKAKGLTFEQIGQRLGGITRSRVHQIWKKAREEG